MYDVISFGSGVVDAFIYTNSKEYKKKISFLVGTKILIENIIFSAGGGGINTSSCFSRLGLHAGFLGKIGVGYNGEIILRELKKRNVNFIGKRTKMHTGYSIILETTNAKRTILTYKGASDNLKFSEINFKELNTKWFYFTSMLGESFKTQKKLASYASKRNIKLGYNPSIYQTKKGVSYLKQVLKHTTFLSLNKEEARSLIKKKDVHKELHKLGPKIVCITDGENQGQISDGIFFYRFWPPKVNVVEKTGAGDAFGASFVAALIKTNNIEKAIKLACINSNSLISKHGTEKGLMSWKNLKSLIKKTNIRLKIERL